MTALLRILEVRTASTDVRISSSNHIARQGGMDGNFRISCRRGQMLLVACDKMKLTDPDRKLCR